MKIARFLFPVVLLLVVGSSFAARVDTVTIHSDAMEKDIRAVVILPDSYEKNALRYPALYLLHGYGGNYANWIMRVPSLKEQADTYQMIIVCPDGAIGSWYFDQPKKKESQYKTHVGVEVPAFIDSHYRTVASRTGRAIAGLSMGGHGALYLSWNCPETFGAAGSMSGAVNLIPWKQKFGLDKIFDTTIQATSYFEKFSVLQVVTQKISNLPEIIIDCGLDDMFIEDNRALHATLMKEKISHDYIERPGKHDWKYWDNAVSFQLLFFDKFFKKSALKVE